MRQSNEQATGLKYWTILLIESVFFLVELLLETGTLGMYL